MKSRYGYFGSLYIVLFLCLFFLIKASAYAIVFNDGNPGVFTDVNTPQETYYGGSDLGNGGAQQLQSTSMTFNIQNFPNNNVLSIIGGSLNTAALGSTILGDVTLNIANTHGFSVYGGGVAENGLNPAIVQGVVNITITDSQFTDVFGGGYEIPIVPGERGSTSVGGVNINVSNSDITNLHGSASSVGLEPQRFAVQGDINILVTNGSNIQKLLGTSETSASVRGSLSIYVDHSNVTRLICMDHAVLIGNVRVELGPGANVGDLILTTESPLFGTANFIINGGNVTNFNIGPSLGNLHNTVFVTLRDGYVANLNMNSMNSSGRAETVEIFVQGGVIGNLQLCPDQGTFAQTKLIMTNGNVNNIQLGTASGRKGIVQNSQIMISSGIINNIQHLPGVQSSGITFLPGGKSAIYGITEGKFSSVVVQKGARSAWGVKNQTFSIAGDYVDLSGIIEIPDGATIKIDIGKNLVVNNGKFKVNDTIYTRTEPFIEFVGEPGCSVEVKDPLDIDLSVSPGYLSKDRVLLARATENIANPNIFETQNRVGLIWSGIFFDKGSWYLTNFEISKDFYGYSSANMASSWLRQRHIGIIQNRSVQALLDSHDGFWTDVQGGYEKLDVTVGTSKMPWFIVNMGYDKNHQFSENWAAIYGCSLGFDFGHNKWNLFNKVKNTITTGLIDGYVGIASKSGLYGVGAVQLSVGKVRSYNSGFLTTKSWTEVVPTESLELGWRYAFNDVFSVTPRAQLILEQISKRKFSFTYVSDRENITLPSTTVVTTVLGVGAAYDISLFNIYANVDWIKGASGEYNVHSQFFNKTFKEKNDNNVVRTSLGCSVFVRENMNINASIFGDMVDNKGFGAQAGFSYNF